MSQEHLQSITHRISQLEKSLSNNKKQSVVSKNITEGVMWMDFHKDIVAKRYIVPTTCDKNKLLATNEQKQIISADMDKFITGKSEQIIVEPTSDGGIFLSCPQSIGKTSTPEFTGVKITGTPSDTNDVVTKGYVDNLVKGNVGLQNINTQIKQENILQEPSINIKQPESSNNTVDTHVGEITKKINDKNIEFSVDDDGTLNITNKATCNDNVINEIDLYAQRLNLLSNINSVDPKTGALVLYGGLGVIKDVHIEGGLYLPSKGGESSKLDYFEEGVLDIKWCGIWKETIKSSILYQRIGNWVMIMIPYIAGIANKDGVIENTIDTRIPKRLCPIYDMKIAGFGTNADAETDVRIIIYGDDGRIKIYPTLQKQFSKGMSGFDTFSISYMIDVKKNVN